MNYHKNTQINLIIKVLIEKKGQDILLMDLRELSASTDFFIICTGISDQHVKSLSKEVADKSKESGNPVWHIEGAETRRWMLLDFIDIVVHVFRHEDREFYSLERLWGDAKFQEFKDEIEPDDIPRSPFEFSQT